MTVIWSQNVAFVELWDLLITRLYLNIITQAFGLDHIIQVQYSITELISGGNWALSSKGPDP